ncbi:DNA polymerase III subunit chi [Shimia sp.]|uniref:DNA polymerase III subunit chi n=1 Tax=Shimia sp. TaxID=1954381 RepID=UPI003297BF44
MGAVYFYHLTQAPLEVTLPRLLDKARGAGWKILIRGRDPQRVDWLDQKLWLLGDESFLPHGQAGGPHDALQPVLLSAGMDNANGATCVMTIDGAEVLADEVNAADRVCVLFDGHDIEAVQQARVQWKTLTDAGCSAQYWSEESGSWQKKAESG